VEKTAGQPDYVRQFDCFRGLRVFGGEWHIHRLTERIYLSPRSLSVKGKEEKAMIVFAVMELLPRGWAHRFPLRGIECSFEGFACSRLSLDECSIRAGKIMEKVCFGEKGLRIPYGYGSPGNFLVSLTTKSRLCCIQKV
jgi:hypothetical protein